MAYKKRDENRKTVSHYLKIYFISLFLSALVLMTGYYFRPVSCANSATCKSDLSLRVDNDAVGSFHGSKVIPPKIDLAMENLEASVLGERIPDEKKHIYIDLSKQTLYAYDGDEKFMQTFISSGKWNRTPTGNFNIWTKLRATRMAGGRGADAYNLPNVPWVMYYFNDFGLHGAYWHNNFGYPMSHGCVNMRIVDAKELFNWADGPTKNQKGTAISVCSEFVSPSTCVQD